MSNMSTACAAPNTHLVRIALGIILHWLGHTTIRVALTKYRVDSRSQDFGVLGFNFLVLRRVTSWVLRDLYE